MVVARATLAVVIGVAFGVPLSTTAGTRDRQHRAQRAAQVAAVNGPERLVVDVETGERGYVITGEE